MILSKKAVMAQLAKGACVVAAGVVMASSMSGCSVTNYAPDYQKTVAFKHQYGLEDARVQFFGDVVQIAVPLKGNGVYVRVFDFSTQTLSVKCCSEDSAFHPPMKLSVLDEEGRRFVADLDALRKTGLPTQIPQGRALKPAVPAPK